MNAVDARLAAEAAALFGEDVALDGQWQARIAADGSLVCCAGADTALQMVAVRLYTVLGQLFYDQEHGSRIMFFVQDESTSFSRQALAAEAARRINADPHVRPGSATCAVQAWDETGVTLRSSFVLIHETHPRHLVLDWNNATAALTARVLADRA